MADPVLTLDNERVSVEPGGQARVTVTVANPGSIVEGYRLDVLGDGPTQWAEVVPAEISVYPQQEATAVVVFSPPSGSAAPGGVHAFGVRARSTVNEDVSAVVEGDLEIGKVFGLQAKIVPVTSTGRWRGRHVVQVSNWGNAPVKLHMVASNPDSALGFYLHPEVVQLPLGSTATVRVSVRTRKPFLRGTPVRLPFQIVGERSDDAATPGPAPAVPYGDAGRPVVDGALNQVPILSRAFVLVAALVTVAAVGVGIWAFRQPPRATADLADLGPPGKPVLTATAAGPGAIELTWDPIDQVTSYEVQEVRQGSGSFNTLPPINGSQVGTRIGELEPDTEHCYKLVALRGDKRGPESDEACVRTSQAPASPSPTPSVTQGEESPPISPPATSNEPGSGPPTTQAPPPPPPGTDPSAPASTSLSPGQDPLAAGAWVIVAGAWPQSISGPEPAQAMVSKLRAAGLPQAQVIESKQYPNLSGSAPGVPFQDSWLAVVGPYETSDLASADCDQVRTVSLAACLVRQPEPA